MGQSKLRKYSHTSHECHISKQNIRKQTRTVRLRFLWQDFFFFFNTKWKILSSFHVIFVICLGGIWELECLCSIPQTIAILNGWKFPLSLHICFKWVYFITFIALPSICTFWLPRQALWVLSVLWGSDWYSRRSTSM